MIRAVTAVLLFAALASPACAATVFSGKRSAPIAIAAPRGDIPETETLVYDVRWLGIPIGTGWIRIRRTGSGPDARCVILARAHANDWLMRFYPVRDLMQSLVRVPDLTAVWAQKNIREGRYRAHERIDFDDAAKNARYQSFTNGSYKDVPIEGPLHDVLGAFYWFRLQSVRAGKKVSTSVFADEKTWDFAVKVLRTERLEIRNLGAFDVFVAEPEAHFKGVLVDRGKVNVWFTADERRIPVLIRLWTRYGPASGTLQRID